MFNRYVMKSIFYMFVWVSIFNNAYSTDEKLNEITIVGYNVNTHPLIEQGNNRYQETYPELQLKSRADEIRKFLLKHPSDTTVLTEVTYQTSPEFIGLYNKLKYKSQYIPHNLDENSRGYIFTYNPKTLTLHSLKVIPLTENGQPNDRVSYLIKGKPNSKYKPITNDQATEFKKNSFGSSYERSFFIAELETNDGGNKFYVVGIHPQVHPKIRIIQTRLIMEHLKELADETPILIVGDGNFIPNRGGPRQIKIIEEAGYTDITPAHSTFVFYPYDQGPMKLSQDNFEELNKLIKNAEHKSIRTFFKENVHGKRFGENSSSVGPKELYEPLGGCIDRFFTKGSFKNVNVQFFTGLPEIDSIFNLSSKSEPKEEEMATKLKEMNDMRVYTPSDHFLGKITFSL